MFAQSGFHPVSPLDSLSPSPSGKWFQEAPLPFASGPEDTECLKLLVSTPRDFWRVFDNQDSARKIIADALKSSDTTAQGLAENVVERLMAQGHLTFRDLLRSPVS